MSSQAELSEKDQKFREFSLNASAWKVILYVSLPLALYQSLNQLFKILDSMMAAHISSSAVSTVSYLSQLDMTLSALGGGLAVGAGVKISEAYGSGDFTLVKKRVSTLYSLCTAVSILLLGILLPFTEEFLKLAGTPEEFMADGVSYFRLDLIGMVIMFFNNVYISVERARGNSKRILILNVFVIAVKLILTAAFVYVFHGGIHMIAIATILSQALMFAAAAVNICQPDNAFGFSFSSISFKTSVVLPILTVSGPVIVEKAAFSLGKVLVNSMSTVYGALTVGALGISNNIGGISTTPHNGFQDGSSAIISQNLGAGKPARALEIFFWTAAIDVAISAVTMVLNLVFLRQITWLFAQNDPAFQDLIMSIYWFEAWGAVPLGINSAVVGMLYGFGKTNYTLLINFCRVFAFRVPVLWALQQFTSLGSISVGIVMAVSNIGVGILSAVIGFFTIRQLCREYHIHLLKKS
ncbi:MAG: MATE family efflux transporter [Lachnospiraceae bacterium]